MSKIKAKSVGGTLVALMLAVGAYTLYTSQTPGMGPDTGNDNDRPVVLRWLVKMGAPAKVDTTVVSIIGPRSNVWKVADGVLAANELAGDYALERGEKATMQINAVIPVTDKRTTVSCQIFENGVRVQHKVKTLRVDDYPNPYPGVICKHTATR
jgi:hypothetical protein